MNDGIEAVSALALIRIAGHQQNGQRGMIARRRERQRDAVHDRHADVRQQQIEASVRAGDDVERLSSVGCGHDLMAVHCQRARAKRAEWLFVLGYENACHGISAVCGDQIAAVDKTNDDIACIGGRRCQAGPKANALAWRQRGAHWDRGPGINLVLRRVAQDEFEARHVFVLAGGVNDIAFDHQDRNPFMLLCDGRHIIKDETAQVHG